jgi:predicted nucleic acid-binding protein
VTVVIDASLTMAWYFEDESTPDTDQLLDLVAKDGAVVPGLWRLEVANAFQTAIRRRRIDVSYRDASLAELGFLPITTDVDTDSYAWSAILRLAERFLLSTYDAAYLELAHRRGLPLATLDRDLWKAASALSVELLGTREVQQC